MRILVGYTALIASFTAGVAGAYFAHAPLVPIVHQIAATAYFSGPAYAELLGTVQSVSTSTLGIASSDFYAGAPLAVLVSASNASDFSVGQKVYALLYRAPGKALTAKVGPVF